MASDDYHFIVDANGDVWDGRGTGVSGNDGDPAWDGALLTATVSTINGYLLELSIPWGDLGATPAADMALGLLVVSNDLDAGSVTSFSHNGSSPWRVPAQWGDLMQVAAPCAAETCNGADDDCDGATDEDFDLASDPGHCGDCVTVCDAGRQCVQGLCVAGSDGGPSGDGGVPAIGVAVEGGCGCYNSAGTGAAAAGLLFAGVVLGRRRYPRAHRTGR